MKEVYEVHTLGGDTYYYDGPCDHAEAVHVESVAGEVVAQLCLCCDAQLPGAWSR